MGTRLARRRHERPFVVEVITYAPTVFFHCQHCELTFQQMGVGDRVHREQAREALPDDLREEFHALSDRLHDLAQRHGDDIRVRVVDAASVEGFWKSLRHGIRRYPAVIVNGRRCDIGIDDASFERELEPDLSQRQHPPHGRR